MRINVAVPEAHVDAPVLDAALEATTRLNESMLKRDEVPTFERGLKSGIKWRPEPPGAEHFDHARTVVERKWGDCDDLAPWQAASLRHTGEDPGAKAIAHRSGPNRWHAVVRRSDGSIDDPSKRAGMGPNVAPGVRAATLPRMSTAPSSSVVGGTYIVRPEIALRPVRGAYQARADLPWYWREHLADKATPTDYALTSLHTAPTAASALTGAIDGACMLGVASGCAAERDLHKLGAISDLLEGMTIGEAIEIYGEENARAAQQFVGSFWSAIKSVAKIAAPLVSKAIQFIPGVGPVLSTALDYAGKGLDMLSSMPAPPIPAEIQRQIPGLSAFY
jgi:hypothetical protein